MTPFARSRRVSIDWVTVAASALAGGITIAWWTSSGAIMTLDSVSYYSVAGNLHGGQGLTSAFPPMFSDLSFAQQILHAGHIPLTQWQPGYPVVLAALMSFGLTVEQAARAVGIVGAAVLCGAAAFACRRILRWNLLSTMAFVVLVLLRPNQLALDVWLFGASGMALTETVSVPLLFVAILIAESLRERERGRSRWATATLCTLVVVVTLFRPDGIALGFAFAATRWYRHPREEPTAGRRQRALSASALALTGPVTFVLWSRMNALVWGATTTVRSPAWHPSTAVLIETVDSMSGWFSGVNRLHDPLAVVIVLVGVVGPVVVTLIPTTHNRLFGAHRRLGTLAILCAVTIAGQWLLVVSTRFFLDRTTLVAARYLLSAQVLCYLLIATVATAVLRNWVTRPDRADRRVKVQMGASIALAVVVWTAMTIPVVSKFSVAKAGMTVGPRYELPSLSVDPSVRVVTNAPETLWLTTRAPILLLPKPVSVTSGHDNPDFSGEVDDVARFAQRHPVAVITKVVLPGSNLSGRPAVERLEREHDFVLVRRCSESIQVWGPSSRREVLAEHVTCRGQT